MHLTLIAKTPEPGRVKTRLCPPCTPEQAAEVARAAFRETVEAIDAVARAASGDVGKVLLLDGEVQPWMPADYRIVAQRGAGLAERLRRGFGELGPGLIVGMDTPRAVRGLTAAVSAVAAGDDVIGLATDGGYWVIGLADPDGREFDGVAMSRSNTGLAQIHRLHALGRRTRTVAMARDLDHVGDLRALAESDDDGLLAATARRVLAAAPDAVPAGGADRPRVVRLNECRVGHRILPASL